MAEFVNQPIGTEAKVTLGLEQGYLVLSLGYDGQGLDSTLSVKMDTGYFFDELKKLIPGTIDDAVIELIKTAVKGL